MYSLFPFNSTGCVLFGKYVLDVITDFAYYTPVPIANTVTQEEVEERSLTISLPEELWKRAKKGAIDADIPVKQLVELALEQWLSVQEAANAR
jgi:hypothetical protein